MLRIVLFALVAQVLSYPNGPSNLACVTMTPNHGGAAAQTTTSPYQVTVSSQSVKAGETLTVTIGGSAFKGFFMQARTNEEDYQIVGEFLSADIDFNLRNCTNTFDGVTHASNVDKTSISFQWKAPEYFIGTIHFQ